MKYLMLDDGLDTPVIFPETMTHVDIYSKLGNPKLVSAGFCSFEINKDGKIESSCWGNSISLKLKARNEDSEIITRFLKFRA